MAEPTEDELRTCTVCLETKLRTEFHKKKGTSSGLRASCKVCRCEKEARRRDVKRNRPSTMLIKALRRVLSQKRLTANVAKGRAKAKIKWACSSEAEKEAKRERERGYRLANKDGYMKRHRNYMLDTEKKKRAKESIRRWEKRNRKKTLAKTAVNNAVYRGKILKPSSCESCLEIKSSRYLLGHHDDYNDRLAVRWLCHQCHSDWHRINGPGLNG